MVQRFKNFRSRSIDFTDIGYENILKRKNNDEVKKNYRTILENINIEDTILN